MNERIDSDGPAQATGRKDWSNRILRYPLNLIAEGMFIGGMLCEPVRDVMHPGAEYAPDFPTPHPAHEEYDGPHMEASPYQTARSYPGSSAGYPYNQDSTTLWWSTSYP